MNAGDLEGPGDEFRRLAIEAGVSEDVLDAPSTCFGGCGRLVDTVAATCLACTGRRIQDEHNEALRRAWSTVPATLRWASLGVPKIREWVRDAFAVQKAREAASLPNWRPIMVLTGKPGAGKTTLACALMREWMLPATRKGATPTQRARARRARFAVAQDLVKARSETPLGEHCVVLDLTYSASMLVLDEIGHERDPLGTLFGLVHARHREGRPTIYTTPHLTSQEFSVAMNDGGLARRVFDDALVIQVGS
jgi:hypothetical protein